MYDSRAGVCIMQCFLYYRAAPGHRAIGSYIARSVLRSQGCIEGGGVSEVSGNPF